MTLLLNDPCSLLRMPKSHTAMYGDKYYRVSAPRLWDKLTNHSIPTASK